MKLETWTDWFLFFTIFIPMAILIWSCLIFGLWEMWKSFTGRN